MGLKLIVQTVKGKNRPVVYLKPDKMNSLIQQNRIPYLQMMRTVSCIMIIGVHVSAQEFETVSAVTATWQIISSFDCFFLLGVPLFFMISGALILSDSYQISIRKMCKKAMRLFLFYYVVNFLYNLIPFLTGVYSFASGDIWNELIRRTLQGKGAYHLWFLPGLAMIYLLVPLVKEALQKRKICVYYLVLFFVIGGLIPLLTKFRFSGKTMLDHFEAITRESVFAGYFGYFVLGHFIHKFISKEQLYPKRFLLFLTFVINLTAMMTACIFDSLHTGKASTILNNPLTLTAVLAAASVFSLFKALVNQIHFDFLTNVSFGVYLIHPAMILLFSRFGMNILVPTPLVGIPLFTVLIFICCVMVVWPIQQLVLAFKAVTGKKSKNETS